MSRPRASGSARGAECNGQEKTGQVGIAQGLNDRALGSKDRYAVNMVHMVNRLDSYRVGYR